MGSWSKRICGLLRRDIREFTHFHCLHVHREQRPCKSQARKQPPTSQKESSHQKWNLPTPETSSLQNHQKINFYCLRHLVYSILLWHPKQTNIRSSKDSSQRIFLFDLSGISMEDYIPRMSFFDLCQRSPINISLFPKGVFKKYLEQILHIIAAQSGI